MHSNIDFWRTWENKGISTIAEAVKITESFHLLGRKVKRMRFVGLCYDLTDDCIEDYAYDSLSNGMNERERQEKSNFDNIDNDLKLARAAEIDEPLLIEFEDGDKLELCATMCHIFILSMNYIPWNIDAYVNLPNIDANVLFSPLLHATISSVDIVPDDVVPNVLSEIILWFDNGWGLQFYDYEKCRINIINKDDECCHISLGELKKGMIKNK